MFISTQEKPLDKDAELPQEKKAEKEDTDVSVVCLSVCDCQGYTILVWQYTLCS